MMSWRNLKGGFLRSFSVNGGFFMYFPRVSCVRFTTSGRISSLISDYTTKHISRNNLKSNYARLKSNLATKHSSDCAECFPFREQLLHMHQSKSEIRIRLFLAWVSGLDSSERTHCGRAFQDAWLVTVIISVANHIEISFWNWNNKLSQTVLLGPQYDVQ